MNGKELFLGLSYINRKYIDEAENDTVSGNAKTGRQAPVKRFRRSLLLAAAIALTALLVGCGIVYALRLQDLTIGKHTISLTQYDDVGNPGGVTEVQLDVLSLQGIQDSPNYQASQEWLSFTQSYTPAGGEYWQSDAAYWAYDVQDQEMADKLDEICTKYGLKIIGKPWHEHRDCGSFLELAGIGNLLKADSEAVLHLPQGRFFPGGSFSVYGTLTMAGTEQPLDISYDCIKKDVFYDVFAYLDSDSLTQRNYTTKDGISLLLLESSQGGLLYQSLRQSERRRFPGEDRRSV